MNEPNFWILSFYCVPYFFIKVAQQQNHFRINSRPPRRHSQTRAIVPFQGKVELQLAPPGEIPFVLLYPQTKPLRQLCLLTVEASKGPSISCRGLTVQLCWLTLTRRFYLGTQIDSKPYGGGERRQAWLPRERTEIPICLLSTQMTASGPAALKHAGASTLPAVRRWQIHCWIPAGQKNHFI